MILRQSKKLTIFSAILEFYSQAILKSITEFCLSGEFPQIYYEKYRGEPLE